MSYPASRIEQRDIRTLQDLASKENSDNFRIHYSVIFLLGLALMEFYARVLEVNMLNGLAIILGLIQVAALGCYFLIIFMKKLLFGLWKQVLSVAVAPILAFTVLYYQAKYDFTPDYIQFKTMQRFYIAEARRSGVVDAAFYAWYWGGARGPMISSTYVVLIYDETDQIAMQPEARTAGWVARVSLFASKSDLELLPILSPERYYTKRTGISFKKMADHFYAVTES